MPKLSARNVSDKAYDLASAALTMVEQLRNAMQKGFDGIVSSVDELGTKAVAAQQLAGQNRYNISILWQVMSNIHSRFMLVRILLTVLAGASIVASLFGVVPSIMSAIGIAASVGLAWTFNVNLMKQRRLATESADAILEEYAKLVQADLDKKKAEAEAEEAQGPNAEDVLVELPEDEKEPGEPEDDLDEDAPEYSPYADLKPENVKDMTNPQVFQALQSFGLPREGNIAILRNQLENYLSKQEGNGENEQ